VEVFSVARIVTFKSFHIAVAVVVVVVLILFWRLLTGAFMGKLVAGKPSTLMLCPARQQHSVTPIPRVIMGCKCDIHHTCASFIITGFYS